MTGQYTIAICPPLEVVEQVKEWKLELKNAIGWFSAVNAEAHITFDFMHLDDTGLETCFAMLGAFAETQKPLPLKFERVSFFEESRTLFVEPTGESDAAIKNMFNLYLPFAGNLGTLKNIHPHLTIGKGLKPHQFIKAKELFGNRLLPVVFTCNDIALRRFDEKRGQYEIIERFVFG